MKSLYKMLLVTAFSGMLTLSLAFSASAQHDHTSGGGGGGHSSGGGGGSVSRPSGGFSGGHTTVAQPSSRPSYTQRTTTQQSHTTTVGRPNFGSQRGTVVTSYSGHTIGGAQHTGVTSYRSGSAYGYSHPGGVNDHYHGYLPGNTNYHYNHGYYGTYYRPRLGFAIGVLPYGYYPFYFGDYEYFYSAGLFYEYDNDQYTVVEPPVGAEVTTLPDNAQSIVINGQQFYEVDGVYYKPVTKDDGTLVYEVAGKDGELDTGDNSGGDVNNAPPAPQIGDIVSQLPQGSRKININGQVMYMSADGIYYQSFVDPNGNTEYKIVGLPDDDQSSSDQSNQQ